jgi:hypothetical protein
LVILYLVFGGEFYTYYTKRFSPEEHTGFTDSDLQVSVFYNRPFKKGREIFGALVPYGKVWRTGANEATWFESNRDLIFEGNELRSGRYSLWTIPNKDSWTVIFNSTIPPWGIDHNGEAARDPSTDVLKVSADVRIQETEVEQFTISIDNTPPNYKLNFIWDKTIVSVPFAIKEP